MNIGGMHVTPVPTKQPSRMEEPPGTIRTPSPGKSCFTGQVALSKNGWRDRSSERSTIAPMRKPSRTPFFTQALTRQPEGCAESGSAARIAPAFSASLKRWNSEKCSSV